MTKQVSIHGKRLFIRTEDDVAVGRGGVAAGGDDKPLVHIPGSPNKVAVFQDFMGDVDDTGKPFPGGFRQVVGDTGHTSSVQAITGGAWRLLGAFSGTAAKTAAAGNGIVGGALQWKVDQAKGNNSGNLHYVTRVKIKDTSRSQAAGGNMFHVFAGWTDNAAYEFPAYDTGVGFINNASDFVGFYYSPFSDTGVSAVAKKSTAGDSGIQVVALDTGPTSNGYEEWEIEMTRGTSDTGGQAIFRINGVSVGRIDSPIATSASLTPCIYAFTQDTGTNHCDIDYIGAAANRDTGE